MSHGAAMPTIAESLLFLILGFWFVACVGVQFTLRWRSMIPIFQLIFPLPYWHLFTGNLPAYGIHAADQETKNPRSPVNLLPAIKPSLLNLVWFHRGYRHGLVLIEISRLHRVLDQESLIPHDDRSLRLLQLSFTPDHADKFPRQAIVITIDYPEKKDRRILYEFPICER